MNNKIIVYGHADKSEYGFPTERDLIEYLQNKLFSLYSGRYHSPKRPEFSWLHRNRF